MPYFKTSQEWLDQSILLIEARPSTTRVTTRYSLRPVKPRATTATNTTTDIDIKDTDTKTAAEASDTKAKPPRGVLVLKTYDPVSGVALKYKTTKAAEVTRLVAAALGRLGRAMAGVQDVVAGDNKEEEGGDAEMADVSVPTPAAVPATEEGRGGGKKKKKGRR